MAQQPVFDEQAVGEIADRAEANPRTVWKRLAGGKVRGRVALRIDREIAAYQNRAANLARVSALGQMPPSSPVYPHKVPDAS